VIVVDEEESVIDFDRAFQMVVAAQWYAYVAKLVLAKLVLAYGTYSNAASDELV